MFRFPLLVCFVQPAKTSVKKISVTYALVCRRWAFFVPTANFDLNAGYLDDSGNYKSGLIVHSGLQFCETEIRESYNGLGGKGT